MGNSQSSSGTQFPSGGLPVVQSIKPCHLSGDPDLYGLGIRIGFYLQYLAAIIAIVTGIDQEFIGWRAAFVPLAVATFVGLCINSTDQTLVIMDWAIMLELVFGFPLFFALPVFKGFTTDYQSREQLQLNKDYVKQIEPDREDRISNYEGRYTEATEALMYAEEVIMNANRSRHQDVRQLVELVSYAAERYETVVEARQAGAGIRAAETIGGELIPLRQAMAGLRENLPRDLQALQTAIAGLRLGQRELVALENIFPTTQGAKDAFVALQQVAKDEKQTWERIGKEAFVLKRIRELGLVDTVSAGLSLVIYSAYCFLGPWLFFFGIDRGAKAGCDVKVLFFLAPVSVYNHGFAIALKVFAVLAVFGGVLVFGFGLMFFFIGLSTPFRVISARRQEAADRRQRNRPAQQQPEPTVERGLQRRLHVPHGRHAITRDMNDLRQWYHQQVTDIEEPTKESVARQINFKRFRWGFGLSIVLIETVVVVEMTLHLNHLTMAPLLSSTGQLIALLVGIFILLMVLYKCFVKLYKVENWNFSFTRVQNLETWLNNFLVRLFRSQPQMEPQDQERTAGLANRGQRHEEAARREPSITGRHVEEVGEEPLPVHRVV